jgi:hypothetical protein
MPAKNERAKLEMQIMNYRQLVALAPDDETRERIKRLLAELEQKLREIDK